MGDGTRSAASLHVQVIIIIILFFQKVIHGSAGWDRFQVLVNESAHGLEEARANAATQIQTL